MTTDDEREALKRLIYTFETTDLGDNLAITTRDAYALADAILAARKHPEPEWEYGRITKTQWSHPRMDEPSVTVLANTEGNIEYQRNLGYMIVRRIKAGSWEVVE